MKRSILITGITRGLGRALAERWAHEGHRLAGCGHSSDSVDKAKNIFNHLVRVDRVDTTDPDAVLTWAKDLESSGFVPDLLINNAAMMNNPNPLWDVPPEEFSRLIDVNIKGCANIIHAFLPGMIKTGKGIVVNMSSGWGRSTSPEVAPYCASKWAIEGLSQALAQELPPGLACVALNPGIINTEMLQQCWGESAWSYPAPDQWALTAAPYILTVDATLNGRSLTVPG
jgi:NAD(P)-dependent dehydrogenase (short-subunit alcohol dehydrogenase family)